MKKLLCFVLAAIMIMSFVACGKKEEEAKPVETTKPQTTTVAKVYNPLTGISGFDKAKLNKKPVAVMINNISIAQKVQTGVGDADMIIETLAEGGITRLMAIYA
ncbi:MAG: DUF3048 domain-containing protein, partial [Clostridia bacterium]|nr:DUF3048 domain-containing protein [Clostridia bacterium]